jgi:hypothetical protein
MDEDATTSNSSAAETFDPVRFSPDPFTDFSCGSNSFYPTSCVDLSDSHDALLDLSRT